MAYHYFFQNDRCVLVDNFSRSMYTRVKKVSITSPLLTRTNLKPTIEDCHRSELLGGDEDEEGEESEEQHLEGGAWSMVACTLPGTD